MSKPLIRSRYIMSLRKMRMLEISLNRPQALNALTLEMLKELRSLLDHAAEDTSVDLVILRGEGERAFCAGGDVIGLTQLQGTGHAQSLSHLFFELEYQLDYLLHTYPKPVVGIGHGWIMGGGMGLLQACQHKVITPDSQLAMPETLIGFFPDVGAGYFLNHLKAAGGRFMALTGISISAEDACMLGLADICVEADRISELIDQLAHLNGSDWEARLDLLLEDFAARQCTAPPGGLCRLHEQVQELEALPLEAFCELLPKLAKTDPWLVQAADNLRQASPLSIALADQHLKRCKAFDLQQVFEHDLSLANRCVLEGDFVEGVRARLIDRDFKPRWRYALTEITPGLVNTFMQPFTPY